MPYRRKRQPNLIEVITQLKREWRMLTPSQRRDLTSLFTGLVILVFASIAL